MNESPLLQLKRLPKNLIAICKQYVIIYDEQVSSIKKPVVRISLTEADKAARVRFARDYRDFDFTHAIFTGDKCFTSTEAGRKHLWRVNNTQYESKNRKTDGVVVNMWAWMCSGGPGELVYIPERSNGANYLELLCDVMVPTVRVVYPEIEMPEILFFQGNYPIHRWHMVDHWIKQQPYLRTVQWPVRSPDLNPLENLWAIMVQRWDTKKERTEKALVSHIDEVWNSLRGSDLCEVLVNSMRKRCDAVIDAGGALTKY
ncbi:hypothetical protein HF086_017707 [Spodoptera exigua]|uniref:Tc1-like transposase DDE domain-containing protein n=1 Tax=Spodoptera exigua TaxID=7107 RepID=A0A922M3Z1_SPOEX|nr:hypothetical protein HF086_017707 [Spodoptera exigua]